MRGRASAGGPGARSRRRRPARRFPTPASAVGRPGRPRGPLQSRCVGRVGRPVGAVGGASAPPDPAVDTARAAGRRLAAATVADPAAHCLGSGHPLCKRAAARPRTEAPRLADPHGGGPDAAGTTVTMDGRRRRRRPRDPGSPLGRAPPPKVRSGAGRAPRSYMILQTYSSTYGHRSRRTEDPVRSPVLKPRTGRLVV